MHELNEELSETIMEVISEPPYHFDGGSFGIVLITRNEDWNYNKNGHIPGSMRRSTTYIVEVDDEVYFHDRYRDEDETDLVHKPAVPGQRLYGTKLDRRLYHAVVTIA